MVRWFLLILLVFRPAAAQTWGIDFYVSPTGSDTLDCATPGEACATMHVAGAKAALAGPQPGGVQHLHVAGGGYNEGANFYANTNLLSIEGAGSTATFLNNLPGGCGTIIANTGANLRLSGMKISGVADPCTNSVYANLGGKINISSDIVLGLAGSRGAQLMCENPGSAIYIWQPLTAMGGGANNFAAAATGCLIEVAPVPGVSVTFPATQSYPGGVFYVMSNATIYLGQTVTWPGAPVSGPVYVATRNGVIDTAGLGCASLPGSSPGIVSYGGVCQ